MPLAGLLARDAFRDPWLSSALEEDLSVPGHPGTKEGAILNRRMIPFGPRSCAN
jgi:hypothetical protein